MIFGKIPYFMTRKNKGIRIVNQVTVVVVVIQIHKRI